MPPPNTAKARRLSQLSNVVSVPAFTVLSRSSPARLPSDLPDDAKILVRGCTADEDGHRSSRAGRSYTSPPIARARVENELTRAFSDDRVAECIVQAYIEGPSGVVFSLSADEACVEYSLVREGVTGGKINPFSFLLPSRDPAHAALAEGVRRIHETFGPCDIEFVGLEVPRFVQVRPITAEFRYDRAMARLKDRLQSLDESRWFETEFCIDLAEYPEQDEWMRTLYLEMLPSTMRAKFGLSTPSQTRPFLKIGCQHFASSTFMEGLRVPPLKYFVVGMSSPREMRRIEGEYERVDDVSDETLMENSIILNHYYASIPAVLPSFRARVFALRETTRRALLSRARRGSLEPDIPFLSRLRGELVRDDERMCWTSLGYHDSRGIVVVDGTFHGGPYHVYRRGCESVPDGVILLTAELYPEIEDFFPVIRGVISEGGALTSHLAILAREAGMPLMIQVANATRGFDPSQRFLQGGSVSS